MDIHGTVLSWNEAAARLVGRTASDMIGHPVSQMIPYDRRREQDNMLAAIRAGTPVNSVETLILTASGEEIAVTMTASPVLDSGGAIVAASLVILEPATNRRGGHANLAHPAVSGMPGRHTILVVEDEALIGLGLAAMLENHGFEVIGPVGDVVSAIALLDRHACGLAILDINLRSGETSAPLARRLKADGIPFFVTSGYLAESQPAIFGEVPSFPKPVRTHSLVAAVQEVFS
jgi:PAS domain S-box-containing protein